jgi:soluble lytic murein transglycosylase-like protein
LPEGERPYGASLTTEALLSAGDTLRAGTLAESLLANPARWPEWTRMDLEQAAIQGRLAQGDASGARGRINEFSGRGDRRGFWLLAQRRLARLQGNAAGADSLTWQVAAEYPSGGTANALLRAEVPASGAPSAGLTARQRRVLLLVAEARGDFDRFHLLELSLRPTLTPSAAESLTLRGMRLAFRAKEYSRLIAYSGDGTWREPRVFSSEWALVLARAYRNTGQAEPMAVWYDRVARRGGPGDRSTSYWEWAREMESLRRFAESDSLYGKFLAGIPGDRRASALLRRGICRFGLRDWDRARHMFTLAEGVGGPEEKSAARFWLYRVALARGDTAGARASLAAAAQGSSGYYASRAESALQLARNGAAATVTDPATYWREVEALGARPDLAETTTTGISPATQDSAWAPTPRLARLRDLTLLFRRCGRSEWAMMVREQIEGDVALGDGLTRVRRLQALELPDLAARAAVRLTAAGDRWRYPVPFPAEVARVAETWSVAPEWVWAVMRRESFFESSVVSSAGAVGLMQLMEPTARETAQKHGLPSGPLRSPMVNLELGVAHLADLSEQEPGQWPVILAAYNAGLPNARRWRQAGDDVDFYLEMIGYRETREYVQQVLAGFWTYRGLLRRDS